MLGNAASRVFRKKRAENRCGKGFGAAGNGLMHMHMTGRNARDAPGAKKPGFDG